MLLAGILGIPIWLALLWWLGWVWTAVIIAIVSLAALLWIARTGWERALAAAWIILLVTGLVIGLSLHQAPPVACSNAASRPA